MPLGITIAYTWTGPPLGPIREKAWDDGDIDLVRICNHVAAGDKAAIDMLSCHLHYIEHRERYLTEYRARLETGDL